MADEQGDNHLIEPPTECRNDVRTGITGTAADVHRRPGSGADPCPRGLLRRRPCGPTGRRAPEVLAGHRTRRVVRHRRSAGLPLPAAADDLQDRSLHRATTSPQLNLYALRDSLGTPFLLLAGMEPDLKWERFVTAVRLLAERLGVRRTIGLGAIPMAVPHTRPVTMTAHSNNRDLIADHQPWVGEVQVPSSVVEPAGIPDGPARPRRRRLHRARAALSGPDRLPGRRRGTARAGRQVARHCSCPLRRPDRGRRRRCARKIDEQVEASPEVAQVVECAGTPVRRVRRRPGEPIAAGPR